MTNATSVALGEFWNSFGFNALTLFSLVSVFVLTLAVVQQEVLRATRPEIRRRTGRVLAIAIFPLALLAFAVIVVRFVHLA